MTSWRGLMVLYSKIYSIYVHNEALICSCIIIPFIKYEVGCSSIQILHWYLTHISVWTAFQMPGARRHAQEGVRNSSYQAERGPPSTAVMLTSCRRCTCPCWWMTSGRSTPLTTHCLGLEDLDLPSVTPWFPDEDSLYGIQILAINNVIDVTRRM